MHRRAWRGGAWRLLLAGHVGAAGLLPDVQRGRARALHAASPVARPIHLARLRFSSCVLCLLYDRINHASWVGPTLAVILQ